MVGLNITCTRKVQGLDLNRRLKLNPLHGDVIRFDLTMRCLSNSE